MEHPQFYVLKTKDSPDSWQQIWTLFREDGFLVANYFGHDLLAPHSDDTPEDRAKYRLDCLNTRTGIGGGPP